MRSPFPPRTSHLTLHSSRFTLHVPVTVELEGGPRFRSLRNRALRVLLDGTLIAIPLLACIYIFNLSPAVGVVILQEQYLGIFLILILSSVFLLTPATRGAPRETVPWYDA